MTGLVSLVGYTVLLGVVVPVPLASARWVSRAPRLGIRLWQALSVSWLAALLLSGVVLLQPWLHSAAWRVPLGSYGMASSVIGAALTVGALARLGCIFVGEFVAVRRTRRWHAAALALAGRPMPGRDVTILEQDIAAVYCLPGAGRIVVTSGALRALGDGELDAVLAHERAHLRLRHHRLLACSAVLARSFRGVPLLRDAAREIAVLAEMVADDHAARTHDRRTLAAAVVELARAGAPGSALSGGGHDTVRRVKRLLAPPAPLALRWRVAGTGTAAGALAVPGFLACTVVAALATLIAR